jgi:sugar lactone lactonase YvrE
MASAGAVCCLWAIAQTRGGPPRQFELKAESPKFWELFVQDAKLENIAGGFGFTEGPVWDPHGFLYVSDEEKNRLYALDYSLQRPTRRHWRGASMRIAMSSLNTPTARPSAI